MKKPWLIVFAVLTLLMACGDQVDDGKEPAGPVSFGQPSNAGQGEPGEPQPSEVSCEDACRNAVDWCGTQLGTYADCVAVCPDLGKSMLDCMGAAGSCDAVMACAPDEPANNSSEPTEPTEPDEPTNANTEGAIGSSCQIDAQCDSQFCRDRATGSGGVCEVNDFGEICRSDADCGGICVFRDVQNDSTGQCTYACDSFADCPSFWECRELGNGAASVCWDE